MTVGIGRPIIVVLATGQRRGAEIQGLGLARSLAARGHDATALALAPGGGDGLDVEVIGDRALAPGTWRTLRRRIASAVVVAHGSTSLPAVAAATLGTRVPWLYRSIGDPQAWVRGRLHRLRTAALLARADRVVTLWPGAADSMRALYRVRADRLDVIPNNRLPDHFPPVTPEERAEARTRLGVGGKVVLYLGALSDEKQPLDAVVAVGGIDGATLLVAGQGPLDVAVRSMAAQVAPGRVRMLGETSDPSGLLAAADVLVLPSRTEGMPGVVIEAALRGIPVVATAVGAVPTMVRDGEDGFVVAPSDPMALRRALAAVLDDPERFRGVSSAHAAERYGQDAIITRWEMLLADVAAGRRGRGTSARG